MGCQTRLGDAVQGERRRHSLFSCRPASSLRLSPHLGLDAVPLSLSQAAVFIAPPIVVAPQAGEEDQAFELQQVQAALDELRRQGEGWVSKSETGK